MEFNDNSDKHRHRVEGWVWKQGNLQETQRPGSEYRPQVTTVVNQILG